MGKHDIKGDKLQINEILSKESVKILIRNILAYSEEFVLGDLDLVYRKWVEDRFNFAIPFMGSFDTLPELEAVPPPIPEGAYAFVGSGDERRIYFYDDVTESWYNPFGISDIRTNGFEYTASSTFTLDFAPDGVIVVLKNNIALQESEWDLVDDEITITASLTSGDDIQVTYFRTVITGQQGEDGKSAYEIAVENGFAGTEAEWLASLQGIPGGIEGFPESDDKVYGIRNQLPYELVDSPSGAYEISTDLIITSPTAGTVSSQWMNHSNEIKSVTNQALVFSGIPSAGTFRYDWVVGNDGGTVAVVPGVEGAEGAAFPPAIGGTQVGLRLVLWNDAGEAQTTPPGQVNSGDFSNTRYVTATAPNTTGKYAKVWEGNLSKDAHYAIELAYDEPKNSIAPNPGSGQRNLKVSFTCDNSRAIISDTVQIETDGGTAGEFVLYQISGNKAALYHKSNHYWGRIQFRVLFQNSQVRTQDLVNNSAYGSAPGGTVGTWPSLIQGDPVHRESNEVRFDKFYFTGIKAAARTGDITFNFDGAREGMWTEMRHADASAFDFDDDGGTITINVLFDVLDISTTVDNYFFITLLDATDGAEVVQVQLQNIGG